MVDYNRLHRDALISKFDRDMKNRSWILRVLLVIDQMFNVILWNGSQDETISSHVGRRIRDGKANKFEHLLAKFLGWFEEDHCKKSIGE